MQTITKQLIAGVIVRPPDKWEQTNLNGDKNAFINRESVVQIVYSVFGFLFNFWPLISREIQEHHDFVDINFSSSEFFRYH